MRAASTLRLLAKWTPRVHVIVVPILAPGSRPPDDVAALCTSWAIVENPQPHRVIRADAALPWPRDVPVGLHVPYALRRCNRAWRKAVGAAIRRHRPELLVLFRFAVAPFVMAERPRGVPVWVDVEELESDVRRRLADLHSLRGGDEAAAALRAVAQTYEVLEDRGMREFDRVFATTPREAERADLHRHGAAVRVMPNVYPADRPQAPKPVCGTARLLYVGTFGYYPNHDAVEYFRESILPEIRRRSPRPVELLLVGSGPNPIADHPEPDVRFVGAVPDTTPFYAMSDAAIVPLRSGGGSRIKILEAFSHARAVISTTIGADGIEAVPDVHVKIGDSPADFAARCIDVIEDAKIRADLAQRGHDFFLAHHNFEALDAMIPSLFGG
ncbi:MAG TPA: glycosyltransferase family 4 protein [Dongiaceae bacterium]|nr:glycosyltransferase family 4 protein [Dongiaceae bacterium]